MVFDEREMLPNRLLNDLISEGLVWGTSVMPIRDGADIGCIIARDKLHALTRLDQRGMQEGLMGQVRTLVPCAESEPIFDEYHAVGSPLRAELIYQGLIFAVDAYDEGELIDSYSIIAKDLDHARERAERRGLNEKVVGRISRIERDPLSPKGRDQ